MATEIVERILKQAISEISEETNKGIPPSLIDKANTTVFSAFIEAEGSEPIIQDMPDISPMSGMGMEPEGMQGSEPEQDMMMMMQDDEDGALI